MARIDTKRKINVTLQWPGRLDQLLRRRFGDDIQPKTYFDPNQSMYNTTFVPTEKAPREVVQQYLDGFYDCIIFVTEE